MLAVQMGSEVGLRPMQALQNIAVINGRPAVWAMRCLVCARRARSTTTSSRLGKRARARPLVAVCIAKRHGSTPSPRASP